MGSLLFEGARRGGQRRASPADEETGERGADEDRHNRAPDLHRHDEGQVDLG